jgi:hypothetical protein
MISFDRRVFSSRFRSHTPTPTSGALGAGIALVLAAACTSNNSASDGGSGEVNVASCSSPGAATSGPADTHCVLADGGETRQPTDQPACTAMPPAMGDDGGGGGDGGGADASGPAPMDGTCGNSGFGPTMYGHKGADDDCKYDVEWSSTPLCSGTANVYFTVIAKHRTDGTALTGANVQPEVIFNDCMHTISNHPNKESPENPGGTYLVGPIVFDQPGRWEIRFHLFETCVDGVPDSPHGHAAFWLDVK